MKPSQSQFLELKPTQFYTRMPKRRGKPPPRRKKDEEEEEEEQQQPKKLAQTPGKHLPIEQGGGDAAGSDSEEEMETPLQRKKLAKPVEVVGKAGGSVPPRRLGPRGALAKGMYLFLMMKITRKIIATQEPLACTFGFWFHQTRYMYVPSN